MAEFKLGKLDPSTYELISKGRDIADAFKTKLYLIMLGEKIDEVIEELSNKGLDQIIAYEHPLLNHYTDAYINILYETFKELKPSLILLIHSFTSMDLAPALAAKLHANIVTNCTDLLIEDNKLIPVRSMYGGKVWVRIGVEDEKPLIVSIQKGVIKPKERIELPKAQILRRSVELKEDELKVKFLRILEPKPAEIDITKADLIVAAGRGVGDKSGLKLVEQLAEALGATLACSRPLIDLGWLPSERQVGLSGKTVKPKLYIACGISGASQHIVGMKDSKIIVSINTDSKAPIFDYSDYAIIGDLRKIIPAIIEELKLKES